VRTFPERVRISRGGSEKEESSNKRFENAAEGKKLQGAETGFVGTRTQAGRFKDKRKWEGGKIGASEV